MSSLFDGVAWEVSPTLFRSFVLENIVPLVEKLDWTKVTKEKEDGDVASVADQRVSNRWERFNFCGLGVIDEETARWSVDQDISTETSPYWVLDPVDGSGNLSRKIPHWGTQIALMEGGRPTESHIFANLGNEHYFISARRGCGAYIFAPDAQGWATLRVSELHAGGVIIATSRKNVAAHCRPFYDRLSEHKGPSELTRGCAISNALAVILGGAGSYPNLGLGMIWDLAPFQLVFEETPDVEVVNPRHECWDGSWQFAQESLVYARRGVRHVTEMFLALQQA